MGQKKKERQVEGATGLESSEAPVSGFIVAIVAETSMAASSDHCPNTAIGR